MRLWLNLLVGISIPKLVNGPNPLRFSLAMWQCSNTRWSMTCRRWGNSCSRCVIQRSQSKNTTMVSPQSCSLNPAHDTSSGERLFPTQGLVKQHFSTLVKFQNDTFPPSVKFH
ncbi:hypothetical protein Patl1_19374 [Pistacia atlantica]|uniref:Uncharacterized protein n=1 Tax=Pistacia atlantica TaxID=434234 RepID=A0ACC1BZH8_9ROSI|nr:hypothetical protein Patl1_19374 [Pistacia atlantica]